MCATGCALISGADTQIQIRINILVERFIVLQEDRLFSLDFYYLYRVAGTLKLGNQHALKLFGSFEVAGLHKFGKLICL